jgi:hypothetical protein
VWREVAYGWPAGAAMPGGARGAKAGADPASRARVEEAELNRTDAGVARRALEALPGQLDTIDGWIAAGTIGDPERPNAADLQLASTVRLLMTLADARPLIEGRPCAEMAMKLFPDMDGAMPAGSLSAV